MADSGDRAQRHRPYRYAIDAEPLLLGGGLSLADVVAVARGRRPVAFPEEARSRVAAARVVVERLLDRGRVAYGVNTGFGDLARLSIPEDEVNELQRNILRSHSVGVGRPLAEEVVRATMLLLAASLARGHSGVRPQLVELVVACLNEGLTPVVPSRGSLGSSGDLAPLAHVGLALMGEGRLLDGRDAADGLRACGLRPLAPASKEGLAIVNGTHVMEGAGCLLVHDAWRLHEAAELAAALSLDVLLGSLVPFDDRIHALRGREEQRAVAARVRGLVDGSELNESHALCGQVQDPYTLRCIPQVLGATREALRYVEGAVEAELGAVTDNPLVFPESADVLSGGNFHGQPLSLALDVAAIAVAEVAAFSERRIFRLVSGESEYAPLPPFLSREPGTRSGLMIAQYTAAALVAENAVLAHPAGVASLPTSANQEDFNSVGATAALKARDVLANACRIVGIELLCAAQALDLRRPLRTTPALEELHERVRRLSALVDDDRPLADDVQRVADAIPAGAFAGIE